MNPAYYIYYRIAADQAEQARSIVTEVLLEVQNRCGVKGRLLRRRDDPGTWMEIYEDIRDESAFEQVLAQALDRHRFSSVLARGAARICDPFVAF